MPASPRYNLPSPYHPKAGTAGREVKNLKKNVTKIILKLYGKTVILVFLNSVSDQKSYECSSFYCISFVDLISCHAFIEPTLQTSYERRIIFFPNQ